MERKRKTSLNVVPNIIVTEAENSLQTSMQPSKKLPFGFKAPTPAKYRIWQTLLGYLILDSKELKVACEARLNLMLVSRGWLSMVLQFSEFLILKSMTGYRQTLKSVYLDKMYNPFLIKSAKYLLLEPAKLYKDTEVSAISEQTRVFSSWMTLYFSESIRAIYIKGISCQSDINRLLIPNVKFKRTVKMFIEISNSEPLDLETLMNMFPNIDYLRIDLSGPCQPVSFGKTILGQVEHLVIVATSSATTKIFGDELPQTFPKLKAIKIGWKSEDLIGPAKYPLEQFQQQKAFDAFFAPFGNLNRVKTLIFFHDYSKQPKLELFLPSTYFTGLEELKVYDLIKLNLLGQPLLTSIGMASLMTLLSQNLGFISDFCAGFRYCAGIQRSHLKLRFYPVQHATVLVKSVLGEKPCRVTQDVIDYMMESADVIDFFFDLGPDLINKPPAIVKNMKENCRNVFNLSKTKIPFSLTCPDPNIHGYKFIRPSQK